MPLVWLPPVFVLWANFDISVTIGLIVATICCAGGMGDVIRERGAVRRAFADPIFRRFALVLALSAGAACINPSGPKVLMTIAWFIASPVSEAINHWQPLAVNSLSGGLFFGSLLLTAVLLRWSPRRVRRAGG